MLCLKKRSHTVRKTQTDEYYEPSWNLKADLMWNWWQEQCHYIIGPVLRLIWSHVVTDSPVGTSRSMWLHQKSTITWKLINWLHKQRKLVHSLAPSRRYSMCSAGTLVFSNLNNRQHKRTCQLNNWHAGDTCFRRTRWQWIDISPTSKCV